MPKKKKTKEPKPFEVQNSAEPLHMQHIQIELEPVAERNVSDQLFFIKKYTATSW